MRCKQIRRIIETGEEIAAAPALGHLHQCPQCTAYARDWQRVKAGMLALAEQPALEPSLGFAVRLMRRIGNGLPPLPAAGEFFEAAGRRVVYFTLLLAAVLLLSLALPASGPVRGRRVREVAWPQTEIVAERDYPIPPSELPDAGFSRVSYSQESGGQK
jgi:hypothetical protein